MKIELFIKNTENITPVSGDDMKQIREIFEALVTSGGLTRVKGGQAIIHFDSRGTFQRVELRYTPWIRRK